MISLIFAILSSAMVSITMRFAQPRVKYPTGLLCANYIVCSLFALLLSIPELPALSLQTFSTPVGLGAINGILYLSGFVLMQWNIRNNGIVLSSVFIKLGILVPTALSILCFGEMPTVVQAIGFLLAILAIVIVNFQKGEKISRGSWGLLLMLLVGGMCDGMSKIYEEFGSADVQNIFLFFTFFCALLLCLGLTFLKKEKLGWKELAYGALLGIPNFLASLFLLHALATVPAVIAFPTFSVATILVIALAGVLFFHERLNRKQVIGGLLICAALVLLNL